MISPQLNITTLQVPLVWENAEANLAQFDQWLAGIDATDIVVLPEMFTTGFSMRPESLAEEPTGRTYNWLVAKAQALQAVVMGSYIVVDEGKYYNLLLIAQPNGTTLHYNKRHLFTLAGEDKHYTAGQERFTFDVKGWKIFPQVCYDLRFPIWSRNAIDNGNYYYDVAIYVANWPNRRANAWKSLLTARAIENQAYVVGVNRVGNDGNEVFHSGDSSITDYKGDKLYDATPGETQITTTTLVYHDMEAFRRAYRFLADGDRFILS